MTGISSITKKILAFREARDWRQFHNPKDIALSLVLEATEVLEHFQWKNGDDIQKHVDANKDKISEELADVLYWLILMSHDLNIDLLESLSKKLEINEKKYPVDKAKGTSKKYTEL